MFVSSFIFFVFLQKCTGVIYKLNDTEYSRLPQLFALDDYAKCLLDPQAVYCTVRADLYEHPSNKLIQLIQEYSAFKEKHYNYSYIDRGICVTKTCTKFIGDRNLDKTEDLHATLGACLNESVWNTYGIKANLSNVFSCHRPGDEIKKDKYDWIVAGMLLILIIMSIVGSLYDIFCDSNNKKLPGHRYYLSFSIFKNWNRLTSRESDDPRLQILRPINGVKVFSTVLVIFVHTSFLIGSGYTDNPHDFETNYDRKFHQLFFNGSVGVQIFFVISSFLLIYTLQVKSETIQITWSLFPKIMLYRWWRLTATSAALILFSSTWLKYMGAGPLWDMHVTLHVVNKCRNYWWSHIFYFNNYLDAKNSCVIHGWFIAADIQLFILGLIVYLAIRHRRKTLVLTSLFLFGTALSALPVWIYDLDSIFYFSPELLRSLINNEFDSMYLYTHTNIPCYVLGMALGYIIYDLQKRGVDLSHVKIMRYLGWLSPVIVLSGIISCSYLYSESPRLSMSARMFIAGFNKPIFGIVICFSYVFYALKAENTFLDFMAWRGWVIPSRLTYIVYLYHVNLVYIILGTRTQLTHVSTFYYIVHSLGLVLFSFLIAIPYFLLIEAPLNMVFNSYIFNEKNEALKINPRDNAHQNGKKVE